MKTLKYISLVMVLLAMGSCRSFEEINTSPNNVEVGQATPADMMDDIIASGASNLQTRFYDTYAELMQYTVVSSSSNEVVHRYYLAPSYINNVWNNYSRWAANADHMYHLAVAQGLKNYAAVALTLRAMYMDMLCSSFGPIPFKEAFKLAEGINKPKFDTEKDVYCQLLADLEEANALYDVGMNLSNVNKDKLYGGNTKKWQKFTNSLYLRVLMRLSNRNDEIEIATGESVTSRIKKVMTNPTVYPVFETYEDNATVYYSGESPFQNGWGSATVATLAGHRGSEFFINLLHGKSDPRKWMYFQTYSGSVGWQGVKSGMPADETSAAGYPVMNFDMFQNYKLPISFMRCDEVCMIKAEAYARAMLGEEGWNTIAATETQVRQWFDAGIRQSCYHWRHVYCDWLGLTGRISTVKGYMYRDFSAITIQYDLDGNPLYPVIDDDCIEEYIAYNATFNVKNLIECIIQQKFVCNHRIACEAYNDYRRTGYPQLPIGTGTFNNATLPYRFTYPTTTKTTNPDNYQDVLGFFSETYYDGADDMLTPVWWSQAALAKEIR